MSKLWIVHRNPQSRAALARLSGLVHPDVAIGAPDGDNFAAASPPAAVLMGLESSVDFEQELDFAHRHHEQLQHARWILQCDARDADEARRLFDAADADILESPPSARTLRTLVSHAVSHRNAASLAERRNRARIAERFAAWLGGVEVPGLLRGLDPSLADLPMLVRGRRGSGRALLCRYVELFRGASGPLMRVHANDIPDIADLVQRLRDSHARHHAGIRTVWVDEIDRLPISTQNALAEWILHDSAPAAGVGLELRWIATAGPAGFEDRLEPGLAGAFAPLELEVPSLGETLDDLPRFVEAVSRDWTRTVGGIPRSFAPSALSVLAAHPWSGDRAELEAVVRTSLASTTRERLEDIDLCFPSDEMGPRDSDEPPSPSEASDSSEAEFFVSALGEDDLPVIEGEPLDPLEQDEPPDPRNELLEVVSDGTESVDPSTELTASREPEMAMTSSEGELGFSEDQPLPATDSDADERDRLRRGERGERGEGEERRSAADDSWRRLARSLSHEIRNPLVSIRTFAELLPDHFEDETFRARFTELVGRDVAHISDVLSRLSSIAEREEPELAAVDVSALLERLLDERRERIGRGRLLVLRELERDAPFALAGAGALEVALAGLLDRALESLPERGDLFIATRHIDRAADGRARLRVLLRHHNPELQTSGRGLADVDPTANMLEYVLAQTVVESVGGSLTIDATDAHETLILIDLRTPPE